MKSIFIGLLFIFLNFDINMGQMQIGLIPTFVGYILMLRGLNEMSAHSDWFSRAKWLATVMLVFSSFVYLMDLFGITRWLGLLGFILGVLSIVFSLLILYRIVKGVEDIEAKNGWQMFAVQLYNRWVIMAVFSVASAVIVIIPVLALISLLVSFIALIFFLVAFNRAKNVFLNEVQNV